MQGHAATAATPLLGTLALTNGACAASVTGSYFRMLQPGGTVGGPAAGYLANANSSCADPTYTPLAAGTDGGLVSGAYQPEPSPAFDKQGNALAHRIVQPAVFFGVQFSVSTAATDPQTGVAVPPPSFEANGAALGGDLRALGASWNAGHFNQGAPKPNGATPGLTSGPVGTYEAATQAFTLDWTSLIVGGPFDGFTGQWHFDGHFVAATPAAAPSPVPTSAAVPGPDAIVSSESAPELANTGSGSNLLLTIGGSLTALGVAGWGTTRRRGVRR